MLFQESNATGWTLSKTLLNGGHEKLMQSSSPFIIVEASNAQGIAKLGNRGLVIQWLSGHHGVDPVKLAQWTPVTGNFSGAPLGFRWQLIVEQMLRVIAGLEVKNLTIATLHRSVVLIIETFECLLSDRSVAY